MAARLEQIITIRCPPQLVFDLAQLALTRSGLKLKKVDTASGMIVARKGANLRTWGNKVTVQLDNDATPADGLTTLHVTIQTVIQLVDYGTNRKILDAFELELRRLVSTAELASRQFGPASRS